MTIEFHCPHCDKLLKTPDDKAGVRANCPGCGQLVTVPDPVPEAAQADPSFAAAAQIAGASRPGPNAGEADRGEVVDVGSMDTGPTDDTKPCPMCGATIKKAATRCRFCGETLVTAGTSQRVPTKIEAGAVLSHAWEIYKNQVGLLLGATIVVGGITGIVSAVGSVLQNVVTMAFAGPGGRGGNPVGMAIGVFGLMLFFAVLNVAVTAYLQAGLHMLLLRVARGENAEFVDVFSGGRFFWRFFWGTLLFEIVLVIAFVLLIVPCVILSLMFWPVYFVIVDRDTGVIESLRLAHEITTGNYMAAFVLFLAGMGIMLLGIFPGLCIGLLFAAPLWSLLWAVAYCGMNGQLPLQHR